MGSNQTKPNFPNTSGDGSSAAGIGVDNGDGLIFVGEIFNYAFCEDVERAT
jgi:hypothetical protein